MILKSFKHILMNVCMCLQMRVNRVGSSKTMPYEGNARPPK